MMEYPEEKVYRDMERAGYNKLVARNVELEEANAQLLEACIGIMEIWTKDITADEIEERIRAIDTAITTAKLEKER